MTIPFLPVTIPVLSTERLRLRPPTRADAPAIQRHFARWEIIQWLTTQVPWPYPEGGADFYLDEVLLPHIESGLALAWAITHGSDELVGLIEYRRDPGELGHRGFWLAEHLHGQGLMSEAIGAVQDWLFTEGDVERLEVTNSVGNVRSRRVKEKTGARFLGTFDSAFHNGEAVGERWEITAEAWLATRSG